MFDDEALQPRSRADVACERAPAVTAGDGKGSACDHRRAPKREHEPFRHPVRSLDDVPVDSEPSRRSPASGGVLDPSGRVATAEDVPEPVPALSPAVNLDLAVEVVACLLTWDAGQDVNLVAECGGRSAEAVSAT